MLNLRLGVINVRTVLYCFSFESWLITSGKLPSYVKYETPPEMHLRGGGVLFFVRALWHQNHRITRRQINFHHIFLFASELFLKHSSDHAKRYQFAFCSPLWLFLNYSSVFCGRNWRITIMHASQCTTHALHPYYFAIHQYNFKCRLYVYSSLSVTAKFFHFVF